MSKWKLNALNPLNQAGDTIVEVLIVIVVIGSVIAGGYKVAVASLQSTQLSQERAYALKIAEGQVERLKAAAETNPAILTNNAGALGFCVDNSLTSKTIGAGGMHPWLNFDNFAQYKPNGCYQDPNGGNCESYCYYYGIKAQGNNNYLASVRWNGPRGNKHQVQISYRIYQ